MQLTSEHPASGSAAYPPILIEPHLQNQLEKDGFVKLPFIAGTPVLEELQACYRKFEAAHQFMEGGFHHTTHYTRNWELIEQVNLAIQKVIAPALSGIFQDAAVLGASFIVKASGKDTAFTPHQDWTLLDETRYHSVNLWIALQDVTPANGALRLLKGSHRIVRNLRMAPDFPPLFEKVMPQVYEHLTTVNLKAGEAVLFDCGMLHGSFSNLSGQTRQSAIVGLYSKEAPFRFYYNTRQGNPPVVEQYNLNPADYLKFAVGDKPNAKKPDAVFPYSFPQLTPAEFNAHYPVSLLGRIKRFLKG